MLKVRTFWKDDVLSGKKTRSYRPWKRPFKVGSIHECRPGRFQPRIGWVQITRVWEQNLGEITDEDAQNDGYPTRKEMLDHFCMTYAKLGTMGKSHEEWVQVLADVLAHRSGPVVWGHEFKVVDAPKGKWR
jgi:hypothetical protein